MRTRLVALTAGLLLLGAGNAAAAMPSAGQMAEQTAGNFQSANSTATSTQQNPSNSNIAVRIHSPGNNGSVSQDNSSTANSTATNDNTTNQTASQQQSGSGCCDVHRMLSERMPTSGGGGSSSQEAAQDAWNGQHADSNAVSTQYNPSNENISVRIHSPGSDGNVTQNNTSSATSTARNTNETTQDLSQSRDGSGSMCCGSGTGVQAGEQSAWNGQEANSDATSTQYNPSNENISVRIHSPGDNGSVDQSNSSSATSTATNDNTTTQTLHQDQGGPKAAVLEPKRPCCGGSTGIQAAAQDAWSEQHANSSAESMQVNPSNENISLGFGDDGKMAPRLEKAVPTSGDVTQSNDSSATSTSTNSNTTTQTLNQSQSGSGSTCCGGKSTGVQAAAQDAGNLQFADSHAISKQICPSNFNKGGSGSVRQSNSSNAYSTAANTNRLDQMLTQLQ